MTLAGFQGSEAMTEGCVGPMERALAMALRSSPTAMAVTDPTRSGNPVIHVNEAFCRLTGYGPVETIGRGLGLLRGPGTDPGTVAEIEDALGAGTVIEGHILHYRKDGTPVRCAFEINPVDEGPGGARHCVILQREAPLPDVSEQRVIALQEQIAQAHALLREVDHRSKNNLQSIASLVMLTARQLEDPATKRVVQNLSERIGALSVAQRHMHEGKTGRRLDLATLAADLVADLVAGRPEAQLEVRLHLEPVSVPSAEAGTFALLLNELVAPAIMSAFDCEGGATLTIEIGRTEKGLAIAVGTSGIAPADPVRDGDGLGGALAGLLVRQLRGGMTRGAGPGSRTEVLIPEDAKENRFDYR